MRRARQVCLAVCYIPYPEVASSVGRGAVSLHILTRPTKRFQHGLLFTLSSGPFDVLDPLWRRGAVTVL